jgi:hypothetical protein
METYYTIVLEGSPLHGARCELVQKRKLINGQRIVKLTEDRGAYKKGDELTLSFGEWIRVRE